MGLNGFHDLRVKGQASGEKRQDGLSSESAPTGCAANCSLQLKKSVENSGDSHA